MSYRGYFVAIICFFLTAPTTFAATFNYQYQLTDSANAQAISADKDGEGNAIAVYQLDGQIYWRENLKAPELVVAGSDPVLKVDSAHNSHLIYLANGNLYYKLKNSEGWMEPVLIATSTYGNLTLDGNNKAHIVFVNSAADEDVDNEIFYTNNILGDFATSTLVADGRKYDDIYYDHFSKPNIVIDENGNYHIALVYYFQDININSDNFPGRDYIRYINNIDGGHTLDFPTPSNFNDQTLSLTKNALSLDANGDSHITFYQGSDVYYAKVSNNSLVNASSITGSRGTISLFNNLPAIAYQNNQDIVYVADQVDLPVYFETIASGTNPILVDFDKYIYFINDNNIWLKTQNKVFGETEPMVSISSSPSLVISSDSYIITANFSNTVVSQYKLDDDDWQNYLEAISVSSTGSHLFQVRGFDAFGNVATSSLTFEIRRDAPIAEIISKPEANTTQTSATFTVGGAYVTGYKFSLDGQAFSDERLISQAVNLSDLALGSHNIRFIAGDGAGNWQSEASSTAYQWQINAPAVSSGGGGGGGGGYTPTPTIVTPTIILPPQEVLGVKEYADGSLLRSPDRKIYVIENGFKRHIASMSEFLAKFKNQKFFNVGFEVLNQYEDATTTTSTVAKAYGDGQLIRALNRKVFVIVNGLKKHIKTMKELKQYKVRINNVDDTVLSQYADWYADGTLLKDPNGRMYVLKSGKKLYLSTLQELKKYRQSKIIPLTEEQIANYPDA